MKTLSSSITALSPDRNVQKTMEKQHSIVLNQKPIVKNPLLLNLQVKTLVYVSY